MGFIRKCSGEGGMKTFLALAIVALLAACTGNGGEKQEAGSDGKKEGEPSLPAGTAAKSEPVMLTFFEPSTGQSRELFMEQYGNAIEKKFPHVNTNFVHITPKDGGGYILLPDLLASGTHIDVVFSSIGAIHSRFIDYQLQSDITDLITKYKYDLSRLDDTAVGLMREIAGGGIYGLPVTNNPGVLVYNRDLFDKFGVPYPRDGMTWDETYDIAKKMTRTDGGVNYRGFVTSFSHIALMNQLSANFVDRATFKPLLSTDDKWKKHADNLVRFFQIPGNEVKGTNLAQMNKWFIEERIAAMYATQVWLSPSDPLNLVNWDLASLPEYGDLRGIGSQPYPTYFNITNMAKGTARDTAFQVIAWLTSDEYQLAKSKEGVLPMVKSPEIRTAFGSNMPFLKGRNVKALMPAKPAAASVWTKYTPVANAAMLEQLDKVLQGQIDVNAAMRQAAEAVEKKVAEDKAK
ncbi:extracellular solute-binding protein [Paenibacillus hemerocallicola]|uniref:Extracellular solute-binding protein n=1 Tax=Paenibacillus hemerocallicola TaxID=1172614 RepID=A0A5C4T9C4_9BACL|nr:extracellular solute-binding protein [Paenibacillus hemerocallicola]TNJ64989.1 extracellular solute-binding protein [Paenibacillus hemerocallicola]